MDIDIPDNDYLTPHLLMVFRITLQLIGFLAIVFSVVNLFRGLWIIAICEIVVAILAICFIFYTNHISSYKVFKKVSAIFLIILYCSFVFVMTLPASTSTVHVWMFLFPSMSYLFLGKKFGFYLSLPFVLLALAIFCMSTAQISSSHYVALANLVACMLFMWFIAHIYETTNTRSKQALAHQSLLDPLTLVYNRKVLELIYKKHSAESSLALVVIDIDFFKRVNDDYGHHIGDSTLIQFSKLLNNFFKKVGYVVRMGGEEFCILMPKITKDQAIDLTEQFLTQINHTKFNYDEGVFQVTFSAGLAQYPNEAKTYSELQKIADKRMYVAKDKGRNCIVTTN